MKNILKYLAVLMSSIFLSLGSASVVFAQAEEEFEVTEGTETAIEDELEVEKEVEIQYEYILFVHEDCSHCKTVEAFVDQYNIEGNITFKQLKDNDENMELLEKYWNDFNIDGGFGWPMLVRLGDDPIYSLGDTPIMAVLATDLDLDYEIPEDSANVETGSVEERDTAGDKIFFYVGGIFVMAIIGYGIYSLFIED